MKTIFPLLAILGTFTAAILYFRADPPEKKPAAPAQGTPQGAPQGAAALLPQTASTAQPAQPQPVTPAPPPAAEQEEFQLIGVEILRNEHGTAFITGKLRNTGTRTAYTVWGTMDGKPTLCLHTAEPPAKPPLTPGQTILFKRPLTAKAASAGAAALSIHSIETTP